VHSTISTKDVEWYQVSDPMVVMEGVEEFVVYIFRAQKFYLIGATYEIHVELNPFQFELFTIVPVKRIPHGTWFSIDGIISQHRWYCGVCEMWGGHSIVEVRRCGDMWSYASPKSNLCK
jgi:hypothetical protein